MSILGGSQPKVIPEFTGLQVNTSVQVLPIPIIYGCPRTALNLIYYNGFNSQLVSSGGGKGVLSGGKGGKQVEYFATLCMSVGEGPIVGVFIIYQDQNVWTPSTFPSNGAFFIGGTPDQPPWDYIIARWPDDARPYKDTAYYAFLNAQLDASATVPQINIVPRGIFSSTSPLNNTTIEITTGQYDPNGNPVSFIGGIDLGFPDADPADCIYDFLVNDVYGATFPLQFLDTSTLFTSPPGYDPNAGDTAISTYCQAVGLAWSVVLNNVESANSILDRWCKNLVVAPVWNGAVLRFIPYWDAYAGDNPGYDPSNPFNIPKKYFTPYTTPVVDITIDQILQSEDTTEDPITFSRKDPLEVYNTVRLDFRDRNNFFNDNPVEAKDEAHIELYGPRVDNIGTADEFTLINYANVSATMQLRRNIAIMRTFTFKLGPLWGWLDPMNVVTVPDPADYTKKVSVRITNVEDDEDENVTVIAEEFPVGSQSPTTIPVSVTTPPNQGPTNIPPSVVYTPVIFAPTTLMLAAQGFSVPYVELGASGGNNATYPGTLDPNWGGANIWVSLDNVTYEEIGTLNGPSTIGTLNAPLPGYSGVNPDNIDTLVVNLNESDGTLGSFTSASAAAGASICVLQDASGFEVVAYTTATLTAPFTYALTGLYRGMYGTTSRLFSAGSRFLYVGSGANFFETPLPPAYVGKTFWVKLQSFNTFHTVLQDLNTATAYQYTATGPIPVPPIAPPTQIATYRRNRPIILEAPKRKIFRSGVLASAGPPPTPTISITSIPSTGIPSSTVTLHWIYTVAAPSNFTAVWNPGAISATVTGFNSTTGVATVSTPSAPGTYILSVTGTGANTASATAPNGTVVSSATPTITITSIASSAVTSSTIVANFSYTVSAPTGLTAVWQGGSIFSTVTGFSASGGTGSATFTTPSTTGTFTLNITGTGPNTSTATSPSVTVTAPSGAIPIPSTSNRPQYNAGTNVLSWSGPIGGGPSNGTYTPQTLTLTNSGAITTTSAGQLISGLNITGTGNGVVTIAHNNCTLRQCRVFDSTGNVSNVYLVYIHEGVTGTIIEDCLLDQNSLSHSATGNSTISGEQSAGPGINGATVRRCTCQQSEQAIRFILNNISFTENLCQMFGGADSDWFECYPVGGTCNNLTVDYNTFNGGAGAYFGADSGINLTTGSGLPVGNIGPTISCDSDWYQDWTTVHAVNIDSSSGGFIRIVSFSNNGFTTNSLPLLGGGGGATITANSGNYVMANNSATSGSPLNGTGVF